MQVGPGDQGTRRAKQIKDFLIRMAKVIRLPDADQGYRW